MTVFKRFLCLALITMLLAGCMDTISDQRRGELRATMAAIGQPPTAAPTPIPSPGPAEAALPGLPTPTTAPTPVPTPAFIGPAESVPLELEVAVTTSLAALNPDLALDRFTRTPDGTIEYWRKIRVRATSYSPCRLGTGDNRCSYTTASGARLAKGIVAVSLKWFRMMRGQRVYIPGYGFGVIGDYGALPGMWIDLGFDEETFEQGAIVGSVDMYFLTPIPATIPWTLP